MKIITILYLSGMGAICRRGEACALLFKAEVVFVICVHGKSADNSHRQCFRPYPVSTDSAFFSNNPHKIA